MIFLFLGTVALAETPLSTSSNLIEPTATLAPAIQKAVVYNTKAHIFRKTNITLKKGINIFACNDLPSSLDMNSLRVQIPNARILRLVPTIEEREQFDIEEVNTLIASLNTTQQEIALLNKEHTILQREYDLLTAITAPTSPKEGASLSLARNWRGNIDFFEARQTGLNKRKIRIQKKISAKQKKYTALQDQARPYKNGSITKKQVQTVIFVDSPKAQNSELRLQYFVPNASWKPIYHLDYDPKEDTVELKTAAMIQQSTGEAWNNIELELSTSILNGSITVPKLQSWILAEKKEYVPQARPEIAPTPKEQFSAPQKTTSLKEAKKGAKRLAMQNQVQVLRDILDQDIHSPPQVQQAQAISSNYDADIIYKQSTELEFESINIEDNHRAPQGMYVRSKRGASMKNPPLASIQQEFNLIDPNSNALNNIDWNNKETIQYLSDRKNLSSMHLFREAGGLDYRWNAPTKVKINSTNEPIKVPLETTTFPVKTFYEATPSISTHAYLSAAINNPSEKPILTGDTHIFIGDSYAGSERLETTGPKGKMNLALGMDENIRLKHSIIPNQHSAGLISKTDITTYTVHIDIGNYKDKDIKIRIFDQIPLSEQEEVQIELLTDGLTPNKKGIIHWDIMVPAQKTETITFSYKIQRPKNWVIKGRYP